MIGDYGVIRNPSIHFEEEKIPEFVVSKVKYEFNRQKEITFAIKPNYINKEIIKQMLGEK